jgi:HEAT repeat protein
MYAICPICWQELKGSPSVCPICGKTVDSYSREYEKQLISSIARAPADSRAKICFALGERRKRSAVPTLAAMLRDPDMLVRVAALRGLEEIGDGTALAAVEKAINSENEVVRTVARNVLKSLTGGVHNHT